MGCICLYHHAKAASKFWIKKLLNTNSIANRCIHYALSTLGVEPLDSIYAAHWELKISSFFLKNWLGLTFWSEIIRRIDVFQKSINSAKGQTCADNELLTYIPPKTITNRITNYF